ncbi:MAG: ABC transporter ATP-binding protein [Puia sp.]|nr:ABC transporter ATP-binding protein [Puia sp.]
MSPLLSINNLTISFLSETGLVPGVEKIDLEIRRNEIVALVGESGSGKSITSLSVMQLLPTPPAKYLSGEILFTDRSGRRIDLLKQSFSQMRRIRGSQIAMIFQEPMSSLNPALTCGEQVVEAIRAHNETSWREAREQTLGLFEKVRLPDPPAVFSRYPHQLSGGQKQRVMIAIAMSGHPSLLICDEPTTALDVTVQKTILQLIRELQQTENMGVLFITHDLGVVAEIADRALVLYKGRIVEQGPVKELFQNPQHPYTKGLLNCRPILHTKGERLPVVSDFMGAFPPAPLPNDKNAFDKDTSDKDPAGKNPVGKNTNPSPPISPEILIKVEHCRVWYPAKKSFLGKTRSYTKAVDDVSFEIYRGETLGLVGESGSGKSTLGRALLRLVGLTGGRILLEGESLSGYKPAALKKLRRHIQIIFQDPYSSLNPRLTVGSAIAEVLKVHGLASTEQERRELSIALLEKVSLTAAHFDRYPHEFSGGQRQRVVIARALALRPSFIVCDESVSALDVSVQAQVLNLLNDLKKEFGFTIVFISHDLSVIRYISDRILVMNRGKVEEIGEAETVYNHPQSAYTKALIAAIPKGF